ncbi:ROK family protein [Streptomyces sp. NPDC005925]|uniref:ROK family protein n=1 Tax=Streptomyces sp. NPDC005925 TaxID=3157172 RepID=UPI0034051CA6
MNGTTQPVVGIDIGGTTTTAAVVDNGHRIRTRRTAPTPAARGAEAVLADAVRLAVAALADAAAPVAAVGVGTAGVVGRDGRTVTAATDALPGWAGMPLADRLEQALGLPTTVLGDVQAFLAGEALSGAAAGARIAVGVMAGTGIGGAVWAGGGVLRGATGAAGHLGHVSVPGAEALRCPCGATGHVEAVASGPAMTRRFQRIRPEDRVRDLRDIAALAAAGDAVAREVLTTGGRALGIALGGVVSTLDPDVVVVSGGVLDSGPWYGTALSTTLAGAALPALADVRVTPAALGADAVLVGAADAARRLPGRTPDPATRGSRPAPAGPSTPLGTVR